MPELDRKWAVIRAHPKGDRGDIEFFLTEEKARDVAVANCTADDGVYYVVQIVARCSRPFAAVPPIEIQEVLHE